VRNEMMAFGACKWNGETSSTGHKPLHSRGKAGIQVLSGGRASLRLTAHDSRSGWLATPFLCDSCIHDSTPVYPGAPTIHFVPFPRRVLPTP
jgi:hypothetical protein